MLKVPLVSRHSQNCDGRTRRDALRIGTLAGMAGLSLPALLQADQKRNIAPKATSCIMLFLEGGPSTIDMWDMKPNAPENVRGPFKPIATNVAGTQVSEHLPECAKVADKYTIVRSHSHEDNGHSTGYYYALTGYKPRFRDGQNSRIPTNVQYPSIGSKVAKELRGQGAVPPYINLPAPMDAGGPGFLGPEHAPFVIETDPVQPDFSVRDLTLPRGTTSNRMARRQKLLAGVESLRNEVSGKATDMSAYYDKAYDLITSPEAQKAFDIHAEPKSLRERYGHSTIGQCALLSRRLVEAGCRFVGVDHAGWDTHYDCFPTLQHDLIPQTDLAFSALVTDLEERGLLDTTLVVMLGEMGRTSKVNKDAGRDHWSRAQSILFAGGGVTPGQVIGATDETASAPTKDPVSIADLHYTIFSLLGINTEKIYLTPEGRPVPVANGGKMIPGLT